MRPIWKGLISFGLVNIPIRLYSAKNPEQRYDFHFLHASDLSRIRYAKFCKAEEKEVPSDEIIRGFDVGDGSYVILTKEDFERANVQKTNKMEVLHFSKSGDIDCEYFEEPFYLEPQKDAEDAFAVLRDALHDTKAVGIVRYVLHTREHIGALLVWKNTLTVNRIRYQTEMQEPDDLTIPKKSENKAGKKMALELIKTLTRPFDLTEHKDVYHTELKKIIAAKAAGKPAKPVKGRPQPTPADDLMIMLKRSLEKAHATR